MSDVKEATSALAEPPREHLVSAAVRFLRNPKLTGSSDEQKLVFLKQKGLTDEEINEAFLRSASFSYSLEQTQTCAFLRTQQNSRLLAALQTVCNVIVVFIGGGYCIYYVVKTYVLPWLTGLPRSRDDRLAQLQSSLDESVRSLKGSLHTIQAQVAEQQRTVERLAQHGPADPAPMQRELSQLRAEVASLKALMLNRSQFPTVPTPSPAPSIPAWQLVKTDEAKSKADSSSSGEIVIVSGNNSDNSE